MSTNLKRFEFNWLSHTTIFVIDLHLRPSNSVSLIKNEGRTKGHQFCSLAHGYLINLQIILICLVYYQNMLQRRKRKVNVLFRICWSNKNRIRNENISSDKIILNNMYYVHKSSSTNNKRRAYQPIRPHTYLH